MKHVKISILVIIDITADNIPKHHSSNVVKTHTYTQILKWAKLNEYASSSVLKLAVSVGTGCQVAPLSAFLGTTCNWHAPVIKFQVCTHIYM
jgi:hypothetical protein